MRGARCWIQYIAVLVLGPISILESLADSNPLVSQFFSTPILLGAHRGGTDLWPEDTVYAYDAAVAAYPEILLECDARFSADRAVIIMHDARVDRTTNGTGNVADLTLAQIKALDAGYKFTRDGGASFPCRGKGAVVPTLAEALAAAPDSRFVVEFKGPPALADEGVKIIHDVKAEGRIIIASFVPETMDRVRAVAPELKTCYDFTTGVALLGALRGENWAAYKPSSAMLSVDEGMLAQYKLTPEEIKKIQAKGIRFQIHTINDPASMRKYIDMGVDSILTDNPELLARAIAETKKPGATK